jgi:prevent-host-death family protein
MEKVGLYEAKANLSRLAQQVKETGQPITITRRGEPFVDLVPHHKPAEPLSNEDWVEQVRAMHRKHPMPQLGIDQILADIAEGRR